MNTETIEGEVTDLAIRDNAPTMAITVEESRKRITELQQFVRDQMVPDSDYGVIPGTGTKPTLLKPGAEKLCAIYGLAPCVEITDKLLDWEGGFVSYEIRVSLRSKQTGAVVAEGVGCCNSREKKYKNREAADMANTVLKMAKKRALVDATLSATRSSGLFAQDLEDLDGDVPQQQRPRPAQAPRPQAPQNRPQSAQNGNGQPHTWNDTWTMPFGNSKGLRVDELDLPNLKYYRKAAQQSVDENKYVERNTALIARIDQELAKIQEVNPRAQTADTVEEWASSDEEINAAFN